MSISRTFISIAGASLVLGCVISAYWANDSQAQSAENLLVARKGNETNPYAGSGYSVTGTIRDKETGEPLAHAEVNFVLIYETDPNKRSVKAFSDADGKYRVEVPMGNVHLWFPRLTQGYWLSPEESKKILTTSRAEPNAAHDINAHPGMAWPLRVDFDRKKTPELADWIVTVHEVEDDETRKDILAGSLVSFQNMPVFATYSLSADGRGAITQAGTSGKLLVGIGDGAVGGQGVSEQSELIVEPGFDITSVQSIEREGSLSTLTDASGRKTTISNLNVTLENGLPLFTFSAEEAAPETAELRLVGRVVDTSNRPIPEARIGLALGTDGGSGDAGTSTKTNEYGQFELNHSLVMHRKIDVSKLRASLILTKDGYAAVESNPLKVRKLPTTLDIGELVLKRGNLLRVVVVDESGKPLPGATVEPYGDYALRRQVIRVDDDGRGVIRNLPAGVLPVNVIHSQGGATKKLVVTDDVEDIQETTITLSTSSTPKAPLPSPDRRPIEIGKSAPDWFLGWMDGKRRKLSDFHGQVLVLDFWGVWCTPCINAISSMKDLEEHYAEDGVVFVAIHTPEGDPQQIARLQSLKNWNPLTAIDVGTTNYDGETASQYGVRGYPTVLIIDQQGKVAFSTDGPHVDRDQMMKRTQDLAKSKGYSWPIDEDDHEKMIELGNAVTTDMLKEQIDKVISDTAK